MCLRATVPTRQERNARAEERYEQRSLANFESAFADEGAFASTGSLGGTWGGASVASSADLSRALLRPASAGALRSTLSSAELLREVPA